MQIGPFKLGESPIQAAITAVKNDPTGTLKRELVELLKINFPDFAPCIPKVLGEEPKEPKPEIKEEKK